MSGFHITIYGTGSDQYEDLVSVTKGGRSASNATKNTSSTSKSHKIVESGVELAKNAENGEFPPKTPYSKTPYYFPSSNIVGSSKTSKTVLCSSKCNNYPIANNPSSSSSKFKNPHSGNSSSSIHYYIFNISILFTLFFLI